MAKPYQTKRLRERDRRSKAELLYDLSQRLIVTTMVAAYRGKEISRPAAAQACQMTEDDFMRASTLVDDEARRIINQYDATRA